MQTETAVQVTAAYVQVPFLVSLQQVTLPKLQSEEVLIDVLACGICGHDLEISESLATKPQPFGHEIVGVVREIGAAVTHVAPGDQVVLETSSYCGVCDTCRNGRVDLCNNGATFWGGASMGFSESLIAPACAVVPAPNIDPLAAVLAEPCGVAVDMIKTAEITLTDRVLVVGTGAIGLMALVIARRLTAETVVAANRSTGRLDIATRLGADAVFSTNDASLAEIGEKFGGFNKVLITAPPQVIPDCITATAYGGYLVYIGSDFRGGGVIPLDTHALHFGKKQLRASFASPAVYLPEALQLLRSGVVPSNEIVSHQFPLRQMQEALHVAHEERNTACKVVVIPDTRYSA